MIFSIVFLAGLAAVYGQDAAAAVSDTETSSTLPDFLQSADFVSKEHKTCIRTYSKIGCFKSPAEPHMTLLIDDHDPTSPYNKGYLVDTVNFKKSTHSLACRCAAEATRKGYTYFSIRFWGQCYVGKDYKNVQAMVDDPHTHSSPSCVDPHYQACNGNHGHECLGWANADYIYSIYGASPEDPNIDGGYGPWSKWTTCSAACGEGVITRERSCTNPIPKGTGADCSAKGPASETQECRIKECKVDGGWTQWSKFSVCSRSCGGGVSRRQRSCRSPLPKNGGAFCKGLDLETKKCMEQACPVHGGYSQWSAYGPCTATCGYGEKSRLRTCTLPAPANGGRTCDYLGDAEQKVKCHIKPCPIDGGYTPYGDFTKCTKSCGGGHKTRIRICANPAPMYGGKACVGSFIDVEACNTDPCPVDGKWSKYGPWDKCSKTCGGGVTQRRRSCSNPAPDHGGNDCEGPAMERGECNKQHCPINGGFTEWSKFGECTVSCGGGTKTRMRACTNPAPQYGGKACVGPIKDTEACGTQHCPIDGGYTDFGPWAKCTKSCGGGSQFRTRTCTQPKPQYGGESCLILGAPIERRECETQACAKYTKFGPWSKCSKTCAGGVQKRSRSCVASGWNAVINDCKHLGHSYETRKCETQPCPINGNWGGWTAWTRCSEECGKGSKTKSRKCNNPFPQYGGKKCPGYHTIKAVCEIKPCPIHGGYTQWSDFGACTKSCGGGTQTRERACTNPTPEHGGRKCAGIAVHSQPCNTQNCPIDGGWTTWTMWRPCSKSCGGGRTYRQRRCTNPKPMYGGDHCPGAPIQAKQCGTLPCPINGGWTGYGVFGGCTKTCGGGQQVALRYCNNPAPMYNGNTCSGSDKKVQSCNTQNCPIDGKYSPWKPWGQCSHSCGGGTQTRSRTCTPPKYGGKGCEVLGHATDTRECNNQLCPVKQYHTTIACEGHTGKLSCKEGGGKIHILTGRYGREKQWICGNVDWWDYNCKLPHGVGDRVAIKHCEGKQECSMQATDQVFGSDPCKMTFKYMEIMYQCYGGRYPDLADEEQPEIPLLE